MDLPIRCMACDERRPFDCIVVKKIDRSAEDGLPADSWVENFQHCKDKTACLVAADKWTGYR